MLKANKTRVGERALTPGIPSLEPPTEGESILPKVALSPPYACSGMLVPTATGNKIKPRKLYNHINLKYTETFQIKIKTYWIKKLVFRSELSM